MKEKCFALPEYLDFFCQDKTISFKNLESIAQVKKINVGHNFVTMQSLTLKALKKCVKKYVQLSRTIYYKRLTIIRFQLIF